MIGLVFINNDNVVEVVVQNSVTEAYVNDATVTLTVLDSDEAEVAGQVWPTSVDYVPASDGIYRAILGAGVELIQADKYTAVVDIGTVEGVTAQLVCPFQAAVQGCNTAATCG